MSQQNNPRNSNSRGKGEGWEGGSCGRGRGQGGTHYELKEKKPSQRSSGNPGKSQRNIRNSTSAGEVYSKSCNSIAAEPFPSVNNSGNGNQNINAKSENTQPLQNTSNPINSNNTSEIVIDSRIKCSKCKQPNFLVKQELLKLYSKVAVCEEDITKLISENMQLKELLGGRSNTGVGDQVANKSSSTSKLSADAPAFVAPPNSSDMETEAGACANVSMDVDQPGSANAEEFEWNAWEGGPPPVKPEPVVEKTVKSKESPRNEGRRWEAPHTNETNEQKGNGQRSRKYHSSERLKKSETKSDYNKDSSAQWRDGRSGRLQNSEGERRERSSSKGHSSSRGNKEECDHKHQFPGNNNYRTDGAGGRNHLKSFEVVSEVEGDLFAAPKDYSLAHCVAEDMRMGSGIAVTFRQNFKKVDELLGQHKKSGQVAILEDNDRFVYYLVTKKLSTWKPSYQDLASSLQEMKEHCMKHAVKNIAMPRIACGLDRLEWSIVKDMLEEIFSGLSMKITVYNFQQELAQYGPPKKSKLFVTQHLMSLVSIESGTGLVFFGTEDSYVDETMASLNIKYNFIGDYMNSRKTVGEVVRFEKRNEYLYGLIVKKHQNDPFSYKTLNSCLYKFRNMIVKDRYSYFGIEAFIANNDDLTMEKVVSLLRNVFFNNPLNVWICWPQGLSDIYYKYNKSNPTVMQNELPTNEHQ